MDRAALRRAGVAEAFSGTRLWIFDLDNTLYPAECNLFAQIDQRMSAFIQNLLGLDPVAARKVQKDLYYEHGTTLSGLMAKHDVKPDLFMDFVHDIDLAPVSHMPELAAAISRLEGRKFIFTNGSARHAERVAGKLGVLDQNKKLIHRLTVSEAKAMIADGAITGGMIPKIESCLSVIEQGVEGVVILDGRVPHAVLLELFTEHGVGTLIERDADG